MTEVKANKLNIQKFYFFFDNFEIFTEKKIGTTFYISEEQFTQILKKSKSVNGKEAYKLLKNNTVEEKTEIVDTKIDSNNNLFSFNNKGLKVVHVGDEIWFKGKAFEYTSQTYGRYDYDYNSSELTEEQEKLDIKNSTGNEKLFNYFFIGDFMDKLWPFNK